MTFSVCLLPIVLIGGSRSLPLARWLTFGLSCFLSLLYRWWALPRAPPLVCTNRHCPDSRFLNSLFLLLSASSLVHVSSLVGPPHSLSYPSCLISVPYLYHKGHTVCQLSVFLFLWLLQHLCSEYNQLTHNLY